MEAKLIKNPEGYDTPYILTNMEDNLIASTEGKLSLKNCQAIELGYDLDELVEDNFKGLRDCISDSDIAEFYISLVKTTVTEILGDKKFSEDDMKKAILFSFDVFSETLSRNQIEERVDEYVKSLQQTEWDVEFEMECDGIETGLCDESCTCNVFPKLDADGCLILKRK